MKCKKILSSFHRWGSTYLMVERVLELKAFVHESVEIYEKHLQLTAPQWRQAQDLKFLLKKGYLVTKKLQLEDLTPGYFFRKWTGLRDFLQVNGSIIAEKIMESMKKREKELLGNSFFLAAVYMDVHNMDLLSTAQKETAHATVLELVLRTKGFDNQPAEDAPESPVLSSSSAEDSDSDEEMKQARKTLLFSSRPLSAEFEEEQDEPEVTDSQPPAKKRKEPTPQVSTIHYSVGTSQNLF
jgi:hypothetical protein